MHSTHLHHLLFTSFHGIHEEERILGNEYEVNMDIDFHEEEKIEKLEQTLNYVTVYELIKERMAVPTPLLETLAADISEAVRQLDDRITKTTISITKLHPPIEGIRGNVGVRLTKHYV